jgi:thiol-disulfide isomerase/thioredoxin
MRSSWASAGIAHVMTAAAKQAKIAVLMRVKISVGLALLAIVIAAILIFFPRQTAPEVRSTALSGENFSTSQLRGKVILVNFWATYCSRCLQEMPKIVATHNKFECAASRALPFRVALDRSGDAALIDRQGRLLKRYRGEPDWAQLHRIVERALAS